MQKLEVIKSGKPVIIEGNQVNFLLTVEQAANYLTLAKSTLDIWRISGGHGLPFVKLGRSVRYKKSDLDEYLKRQTVGEV